jgi:hypothetical protein
VHVRGERERVRGGEREKDRRGSRGISFDGITWLLKVGTVIVSYSSFAYTYAQKTEEN